MFGTSPPVSLASSAPDEVYHPLDLPPGTVLGRYRLDCAIGRGGMGTVYAAWDLDEERWVAVKVLGGAISDPTLFGRFQREAATVSKLKHPGIVELYHVGQTAQACYIAMRQVQGTTLRGWLNRQPRGAAPPHAEPQPPGPAAPERLKDALRVWRDLVAAVAYAHSVGVAHRDLKPENVMVEPDGRVVVIDFGLARSFTDTTLTTHSGPIGTPMYMAPEQLGGNPAGPASDVYALGLIGYELLSLTLPFRGRTVEALLGEVLHKPIPPLAGRNPAVPPDLANVVHRATAKSPGERYADAGELLADLDRHLAGARVTATGYRYRFNPIEVFAARPRGVSAAVYANFAFGAFFLICTAFLLLSKPTSNDLPEFAGIAAVHLFAGGQMSTGRRWARVGGWCVVCLTLWLIAVSVSREPSTLLLALGALFLAVAAANLVALCSPRGREWFALAQEKRRAFELERSGAAAPGAGAEPPHSPAQPDLL